MAVAADNRIPDADFAFPYGVNSTIDPDIMPSGMVVRAFNAVNRGARWRCRPGHLQLNCLPDGELQGAFFYRPTDSAAQLLVAVAGKIYAANAPFTEFIELAGLQFGVHSRFVHFCQGEQAVVHNVVDDSLTLVSPHSVVVIQDGVTAPGVWDGTISGHDTSLPVGTVMAWSGDRLWVARGKRLFASDYANPLSFWEGQYINDQGLSIGAFIFKHDITALAEVSAVQDPFLVVFTRESTEAVLTYIRQRDAWNTVAGFITTLYPNIGCVGPNAWATFNGMLWWYSSQGLINLNAAESSKRSSEISYLDGPMVVSKRLLSPDLEGVAMGSHENYLMVSVPYSQKKNLHTWVYDSSVATAAAVMSAGWQGYWVGTRPVCWVRGTVNNETRCLHVSTDLDGKNRLWESFQPDRLDNGCPILWGFETRAYVRFDKQASWMRYADLHMADFTQDADIRVLWAGSARGPYKSIKLKEVKVASGSIDSALPLDAEEVMFAFKSQSRYLRTEEVTRQEITENSSDGVEHDASEEIDFGFQLLVLVLGPGSVRAIKAFGQPEAESRTGVCEAADDEFRGVRFDGAASKADTKAAVIEVLADGPVDYSAGASVVYTYRGVQAVGAGTATVPISANAAQRLADAIASMKAAHELVLVAPAFIGGGKVCQDLQAGADDIVGNEL